MSPDNPETDRIPLTNFRPEDTLPTRLSLEDSITQVNVYSRPTINLNPSRNQQYAQHNLEPIVNGLEKAGYNYLCTLHDTTRNKVFLVEEQEKGRLKAAKWFSSAEQFDREKKAQELLRSYGGHKNILLADAFIDEPHFMISRYTRGGNLRDLQRAVGVLPLQQVKEIAIDVLDALQYLADCDFAHCDIKNTNIVWDRTASGLKMFQLLDYELVKHRDLPALDDEEEGVAIGTLHYLAPEVWRTGNIDSHRDIYAAGITFFECLTGRFPFDGTTGAEITLKHMEQPVPDITRYNPELPAVLNEVFKNALAKDPRDRYQSATQFKEALVGVGEE